jgi:hypothetical protein
LVGVLFAKETFRRAPGLYAVAPSGVKGCCGAPLAPLLAGLRPLLTPPGATTWGSQRSDASVWPLSGPASDRGRDVAVSERVKFQSEMTLNKHGVCDAVAR